MLDLPERGFHFRRPFSILRCDEDAFDIYYKVVGFGTGHMAALQPGEKLSCLGPLGNGFPPPSDPAATLYIGGGIGIAPLLFDAEHLLKQDERTGHCVYGVRSAADVGLEADLKACFGERLAIATDDGSAGFHGNVVQYLSESSRDERRAIRQRSPRMRPDAHDVGCLRASASGSA